MGKTTKTAARDVTSPAVVSLVEDLASQALAAGVRTTAPGTLKREALSAGGSTQAVDSSHGQLPTLRSLDVTGQDLAHASVLLDLQLDGQRYLLLQYALSGPTKPTSTATVETTRVDIPASLPAAHAPASDSLSRIATRDGTPLSPREQEIARMVMKGYPNKTIAAVLDISVWTVGTHLRRIFTKLGVVNRAAMVAQLVEVVKDR